MSGLFQDLRYALRQLRKTPGFTAVALLTMALGIGANVAIFSVVNAVLLRPLPYKDPGRLVYVWSAEKARGIPQSTVSIPDLDDWRQQNRVFEGIAGFTSGTFNLSGGETPAQVNGLSATANLFDVLGVKPELGRTFAPDEEQWGKHRVVILSHSLWQQSFGGDRMVTGKEVTLNAEPYTVIGVLPAEASSPDAQVRLWVPVSVPPGTPISRDQRFLRVMARVKPGVSLAQAQADMSAIAGRLEQTFQENNGVTSYLVTAQEQIIGGVRPALLVLLSAVLLVLLIACTNLASLLLARSAERQTEFAIRAVLGSGRFRMARQLLTESLTLALLGGGLGVLLGFWSTHFLHQLLSKEIPKAQDIHIDTTVLGFALGLSVITGLVFGLAPALQSFRNSPNESLKERGRGLASGLRTRRIRNVLVVGELALALVLLVGAGLLVDSLRHLRSINPGFAPEEVLTAEVSLPFAKYRDNSQRIAFFQNVLDRLRALPGVQSAGATLSMPLGGGGRYWMGLEIEGRPNPSRESVPVVAYSQITPGYLEALHIPLLAGRRFDEHDNSNSRKVALISQSLARRYFSNEDPIGKVIRLNSVSYAVVGVVGDAVVDNIKDSGMTAVYVVHSQAADGASGDMVLAVRTASGPLTVAAAMREAVRSLDKDQSIADIQTLEQTIDTSLGQPRLNTWLLASFSTLALVLALVGIYGVMSYSVTQRSHEIGIRMALGAAREDVLKLVVTHAVVLTAAGISLGLVGAFSLTRFLKSLLYGVQPTDWATFLMACLVMALTAGLSGYIPARRATKVDPMVALRYE